MSASTFDTLQAARQLEDAGLERKAAEAVASAIRAGQNELATKGDIRTLQWVIGIHLAISLATLAGVLALAFK